MKYFLLLLCAAGLAVTGCSSSTVESNPEPANHTLKQGDTFTYHEYQTDKNGQSIAGTDTTIVATVTATGMTIDGMSNVAMIVMPEDTIYFASSSDSLVYVHQDSIVIAEGVMIPNAWVPCKLQPGSRNIVTDSVDAIVGGTDAKITITIDYQYDRTDTSVVGTEKLLTHVFEKKVLVDFYIPAAKQHFTTLVTSTYHYAPKLGFFTSRSINFTSNNDQSPYPDGTTYDDLVSYQLK